MGGSSLCPANIYLFKVNNRSTTKLRLSGVFTVNVEHISHLFLASVVDFKQVNVSWVTVNSVTKSHIKISLIILGKHDVMISKDG